MIETLAGKGSSPSISLRLNDSLPFPQGQNVQRPSLSLSSSMSSTGVNGRTDGGQRDVSLFPLSRDLLLSREGDLDIIHTTLRIFINFSLFGGENCRKCNETRRKAGREETRYGDLESRKKNQRFEKN